MQPSSDRAKDAFGNKNRTKIATQNLKDLDEHARETPNDRSISPSVDPIPFLPARTEPQLENSGTTLSWNSSSENPQPTKHDGGCVRNAAALAGHPHRITSASTEVIIF